jgi:hypothetical protein
MVLHFMGPLPDSACLEGYKSRKKNVVKMVKSHCVFQIGNKNTRKHDFWMKKRSQTPKGDHPLTSTLSGNGPIKPPMVQLCQNIAKLWQNGKINPQKLKKCKNSAKQCKTGYKTQKMVQNGRK